MKITKLSLVNFRNYLNSSISFGDHLNILVGDNAQGKTNILEAIIILALTKSHRIGTSPNLIMFGKTKSKINGVVKKDKILSKLEIELADDYKKLKVNQTEIRKVADYISYLNIIVFTPDDLEIVKGSPNVRRNLLNVQLSQISKEYLNYYNEYNKLLKTRNEYLKILFNNSIADTNYLDIITEKLIEKAVFIYQKRNDYINLVNLSINSFYKDISGEDGITIQYLPNIELDNYDSETIRKKLKHTFKKNYMKELNYGMTIYGPHRDDFIFEYHGHDLKYYGSQGLQRSAILSFKLSETNLFKERTGNYPIVLLDDVFSELDKDRIEYLMNYISNFQVFITTTEIDSLKDIKNKTIFKVKNGNVEKIKS